MKTETQISKENVKKYEDNRGFKETAFRCLDCCKEHSQSCQREKEFLEKDMMDFMNINGTCYRIMDKKIIDLQNAISVYKENGIEVH